MYSLFGEAIIWQAGHPAIFTGVTELSYDRLVAGHLPLGAVGHDELESEQADSERAHGYRLCVAGARNGWKFHLANHTAEVQIDGANRLASRVGDVQRRAVGRQRHLVRQLAGRDGLDESLLLEI